MTDYADGLLARRRRKKSFLGALLDPVADKIFVVSVFLVLTYLGYTPYVLVFLLILRELLVSFMRSWFPEDLRVIQIARLKTFLQMVVAGLIVYLYNFVPKLAYLINYLLGLIVFISYLSALPYFYRFIYFLLTRNILLIAFIRSFFTLFYPFTLLIIFPYADKLFFIPILALSLYFFRNGLAKVMPFREKGERNFYYLTILSISFEYFFWGRLFYSLFILLGISLYIDGVKNGKIIWRILKSQ